MIDHFTVSVSDLAATRAFYEKALAPLGYTVKMEFPGIFGMGDERKPYFWLKQATPATTPQHIAFRAHSREAVDAFHQAALEAGGKDDGAPGIRDIYHPNYYAAFVIDPLNGHPIEAVVHTSPPSAKPKAAKPATPAKKKAAPAKKAKKKR